MLGAAQLENYLSTLLIGKKTEVDFRVEGDSAPNLILESLWGLAEQTEVLRLALYPDLQMEVLPKFFEQKFEDRRSLKIAHKLSALIQSQGPAGERFAKTLLKNRVARVSAGVINALKLKLTPEQVIVDSTSWNVDRASPTYLLFLSFCPEGTVYYLTFIERMMRPEPKGQ
jgi:hypothetical protein